jgi:hypothetical protein
MGEEEKFKLEKGSSSNQSSQHLFKGEAKINIKPYEGEVDMVKLNNWLW